MRFILIVSQKLFTSKESGEDNKNELRKSQILRITINEIEKI